MPLFMLHHTHEAEECPAAFAAWKGFDSPLRRSRAYSSCLSGGHEIWWDLDATSAEEAMTRLPRFVADRTVAVRIGEVEIP